MDPLRPNRLLESFPSDARVRLMPHQDVIAVRRGEVLSADGSLARYVYFPNTAVLTLLAAGSSACVADVGAVGFEGAVDTLSALATCAPSCRVIARIPGTVTRIPAETLRRECRRASIGAGVPLSAPSVQEVLVRSGQFLMAQAAQLALCNVVHAVPLRLVRWLLMLGDRVMCDEIPVTHEMLSEMLGVRRPGITVILGHLEEAGLITCRRGRMSLRNRERLECRACGCYGSLRASYNGLHLAQGTAERRPIMARAGYQRAMEPEEEESLEALEPMEI